MTDSDGFAQVALNGSGSSDPRPRPFYASAASDITVDMLHPVIYQSLTDYLPQIDDEERKRLYTARIRDGWRFFNITGTNVPANWTFYHLR